MSDRAIIVNGLAKKYRIGASAPRYKALRDHLAETAAKPFRALRNLFHPNGRRPSQPATTEFWALKDVSFEIHSGDVVGIIGRNGAGKSTLLKILSRITEPTAGEVEIHGRVGSLLEVGTGFHPELTGRENIFLNGAILGMRKSEIERRFDEIVAFAEVEQFLDTPVKYYSSGMYLRLAFAVAAHLETDILLVDEVLAVGDAEFQKKSIKKMHDAAKSGRTVLFVSHNMGAITRLCATCLHLHSGAVLHYGNAADVVARYLAGTTSARSHCRRDPNQAPLSPIQFLAVSLKNGVAGSSIYRGDQDIHIILEYQVSQKVLNAGINIRIYSHDGVPLLSTADTDAAGIAASQRAPGLYRSTVVIPAHTLAPGFYYVMVAAHAPGQQVYDLVENAVTFEVTPVGSLTSLDNRLGYFAPLLHWRTIQEPFPGGFCAEHSNSTSS